jgi:hypothetical protein
VGIGRRKREVPVDEPDDLCPLHASGRRTHELDDFVGQVMAAVTRQLGADSSALRLLNLEQNTVTVELLFQDGRVMSSAEAKYPECWRSLSLDEQRVVTFLYRPSTLASRPMIVARRLFGLATDPALAIRINLVQSGCNRSVLK